MEGEIHKKPPRFVMLVITLIHTVEEYFIYPMVLLFALSIAVVRIALAFS